MSDDATAQPDDATAAKPLTAVEKIEQRTQQPAAITSAELKEMTDAMIAEMRAEIAAAKEELAKAKPVVPPTDTKPAPTTTPEPDFSTLSPVAKISRGYKQ